MTGMNQNKDDNEFFNASHIMVLVCLTIFSFILIGETILMGWEKWAILLILASIGLAWRVHVQAKIAPAARLWIYSVLIMMIFFFYGTHLTSAFDAALIMILTMIIFTMTGSKPLIRLCQITYYITFGYDIFAMIMEGENFDALLITRSALHVIVVSVAAWVSCVVIDNWEKILAKSHVEIEELKGATERLDNFLANVSHEIRTPVNAVMGLSAVLEKEELPDGILNNIVAISEAGHRVSEQISDILDFTEIDMGKLTVSRETYMINSLVNDLLVQLSFAEDYGLDLVIDMEASIPAELVGDGSKIKKILWHLVCNGYKFSREGGVYVHIYPVKRDYGVNLVLEVKDTGIGMSAEEIERAYEKFYQSDSGRTRTAGGLGLGIPIVNGFTKAMDGVLAIESDENDGTVVRVSIPQEVSDPGPCISVKDRENCVVAGFLGFMTTGHQGVREFYMTMIAHLVSGLGVPFKRVQSREELEKLINQDKITHLFVGTGEYLENREYIDKIANTMNVALVEDRGFNGEYGRGITPMSKPFYGAQVANFLNHAFDGADSIPDERMTCPGLEVLVVDDEPMNLMVARGIFETYGMVVSTASGGRESIEMCANKDYDLVFMDHMMPEMDGVEAMKRLKLNASRMRKELLVVALTANAISSAKEMFLSEGFDGFIPKPIEITELERVLKKILPKSSIVYEKISSEGDDKKNDGVVSKAAESASKPASKEPAKNEDVKTAEAAPVNDVYKDIVKCGVDVHTGLRYCKDDEEFYKQLLLEYARDHEEKLATLNKYYEEENWHDYSIRVHAIKSTSKMIGNIELSDMAKALEDASKCNDAEKVKGLHPVFVPQYEALLNAINKTFGGGGSGDSDDEVLEFEPEAGDDVLEFAPEGEE